MSRKPNSNDPEPVKSGEKMLTCLGPCKRVLPWYEFDFERLCHRCRPAGQIYGAGSDSDFDGE